MQQPHALAWPVYARSVFTKPYRRYRALQWHKHAIAQTLNQVGVPDAISRLQTTVHDPVCSCAARSQVTTLFQLMGDKKEDDEFVLQIAFTFHKFLLHDETRASLLTNTQQVVFYLVDLLQDKNKEVGEGMRRRRRARGGGSGRQATGQPAMATWLRVLTATP